MRIIKKIFFWFVGAFVGFFVSVIGMAAAGIDVKTGSSYTPIIVLAFAFFFAWKFPKPKQEGEAVQSETSQRIKALAEKSGLFVDISPIGTACETLFESDPKAAGTLLASQFSGPVFREGLRKYLPATYKKVEQQIQSSDADPMDVAAEGLSRIHAFIEPANFKYNSFDKEENNIGRAIALAYVERKEEPRHDYIEALGELPFLFQKSEYLCYAVKGVKVYTTKTETTYQAGSRGISVRVAKGLSYRVGNAKGKRVQEEYEDLIGYGTVAVTSKHIYYTVDDKSIRVPLQKLVSASAYKKRLEFVKEAARPKPVAFEFDCEEDADIFIRAIKNGG